MNENNALGKRFKDIIMKLLTGAEIFKLISRFLTSLHITNILEHQISLKEPETKYEYFSNIPSFFLTDYAKMEIVK